MVYEVRKLKKLQEFQKVQEGKNSQNRNRFERSSKYPGDLKHSRGGLSIKYVGNLEGDGV